MSVGLCKGSECVCVCVLRCLLALFIVLRRLFQCTRNMTISRPNVFMRLPVLMIVM